MAAKGNTFRDEILNLILNNIDIANIGDAAGLQNSATAGSLYIALHNGDPGFGGAQNTLEFAYTGYARVAISRAGGQWTVSSGQASNANIVTFGTCTAGSEYLAFFTVGTASSGAGKILYKAPVIVPMTIGVGEYPYFPVGDLIITED